MNSVSFRNVKTEEGFWKEKQTLNENITIHAVHDRFADTGRFDAFNFDWCEGKPNKPHYFWDSDVAKWLEGCAYILQKTPNALLEKQADEVIDKIAEHQWEDGYFNIYFSVVAPGKRFTDRDCHELYCAGHLIEAAVAYYEATGKDKLLKCMCRYADLIEKIFLKDNSAAFQTPGHEEIELALVKLYHCTNEKRYLELAKHFIDKRGVQNEFPDDFWANPNCFQSHLPCREQLTAQGHAVRACYLYSGMADIAREYDDEELKKACKSLFDDIYYKKMYITGGIGQSNEGESFTIPFDLQNDKAYTETCASIALVYFAQRLLLLEPDSRYADIIEKAIYNGILSGLSIDGKSFFYENPLEINLSERNRNTCMKQTGERFPITQRVEVFSCSCCPPNLNRFIASIGDYIYTTDDNTVFVHQYISNTAEIENASVTISSGFPYNGNAVIKAVNLSGKALALRIPGYSKGKYEISISDCNAVTEEKNGYLYIKSNNDFEVTIKFDFEPKKVYASSSVLRDCGKCAITAGPLVYCAEGTDNSSELHTYQIRNELDFTFCNNEKLGTRDIILKADTVKPSKDLYSFKKEKEEAELHLIPYFAFANRGETDLLVWFTE